MSIIKTIVEKILSKVEVSRDAHHYSITSKFSSPKDALMNDILAEITSTYRDEVERPEDFGKERREWAAQQEVAKAELTRDRKLMELDLATKRDTLEQAIRIETDEQKRSLMQTAVENVTLKEKITYLEKELEFHRGLSKDSTTAVNETLRTAFQNQPSVTVQATTK